MGQSEVEYATDQITMNLSCSFDCKYCWRKLPFVQARMSRWKPKPLHEANRYASKDDKRVLLISFWSEPYSPENTPITREMLKVLAGCKHTVLTLTKNPVVATKDVDVMKSIGDFWFGTTLTATFKIPDEPFAPSNRLRIEALQYAKEQGLKTFASVEPVLPSLVGEISNIIKATSEFTDFYVIGRLDYNRQLGYPSTPRGFYLPMLRTIVPLLRSLGFKRKKADCTLRRRQRSFPAIKYYHVKTQLAENP